MVRAIVIGANGYIGNAVAAELATRGHTVYGVIRDSKDAAALRRSEIIPIVESSLLTNLASLDAYIGRSSVVIDATSPSAGDTAALPRAVIQHLEQIGARTSTTRHFIYTSGCLVYEPSTDGATLDESSPVNPKLPRSTFDLEVTNASAHPHVHGTVLRPAWVYGLSSGKYLASLGMFPTSSTASPIVVHGSPDPVWPWIHIADLARAYASVVETPDARTFGHIFNVSDNVSFATRRQVHETFARAAGYTGTFEFGPARSDFFSQLLEKNLPFRSHKLQFATGWTPRVGPVTDIEIAKRTVEAAHAHAQ